MSGNRIGNCNPCGTWKPLPMLMLPTVYDDSLSYYEEICQLISQVNALAERVNNLQEDFLKEANKYTDEQIDLLRIEIDTKLKEYEDTLNDFNNQITKMYIEINKLYSTFDKHKKDIDEELVFMEGRLKQYIDMISNEKLPWVYNPITGEFQDLQTVLDYMAKYCNPNGLTAIEYDSMGLTADGYSELQVSAYEYSRSGRWVFFNELFLSMFSPFTGLKTNVKQLILELAQLHKKSLTAGDYDGKNLSASVYDAKNVSAYNYDWNGANLV